MPTAMAYVLLELVAKTKVMPTMQHNMYATVHQAYFGNGSWMFAMMEEMKAISHASCSEVNQYATVCVYGSTLTKLIEIVANANGSPIM